MNYFNSEIFYVRFFGAWPKNHAPFYAPFNERNEKITSRKKIATQRKYYICFQIISVDYMYISPSVATNIPFFIGVADINAPNHAPFW